MPPLSLNHCRRPDGRAFTLVELLTVIAIVGILAAILIPVIGKVRESARASTCESNLRQLASACVLYANENHGRLVPLRQSTADTDGVVGKTWRVKIEPYINSRKSGDSILICPSDPITSYPSSSGTGEWPASYGLNPAAQYVGSGTLLEYSAGSQSQFLSAINQPARMIMISDIGRNQGGGGADPSSWTEDRTTTSASYGYARFPWNGEFNLEWGVWPRHNGKANVAFYDGHVASLDLIKDLKNHPNGDPLCLFDNH